MAVSVDTQTMIDEVRLRSNLKRSTYFSDSEILKFLNDGIDELRDMIVASYEHYFIKVFDFTLTGDTAQVNLPADFYKANILVLNPGTQQECRIPQVENYLQRTQGALLLMDSWGGGQGRQYLIEELQLKMLANGVPSASQGTYRLYYTYLIPPLALPIPVDLTVVADLTVQATTHDPIAGAWAAFGADTMQLHQTGEDPLLIDGYQIHLGDRIWIQTDDAPIAPGQCGVWEYVGIDTSAGDLFLTFQRPVGYVEGTTIQAGHKIFTEHGDFYGQTYLQTETAWEPAHNTVELIGVNFAAQSPPRFVFAHSTFTWENLQNVSRTGWFPDAFVRLLNTPSNGGVDWPITAIISEFEAYVSEPGSSLLTPFNIPSSAIVQVMFTSLSYGLPQQLLPWKLYPIVFASLTIRKARQQGAADLESELEGLKQRIAKMSANRTEEVTRAPYLRRNRGLFGGGGY